MIRKLSFIGLVWIFIAGCQPSPSVRQPSYSHEQFVADSTIIYNRMQDSIPAGSRYVSLGFNLVKCDAFPHGRLVEHSYQTGPDLMPPVSKMYFLFSSTGAVSQQMTEAEFLGALYYNGSPIIVREPYE